MSFGEATGGGAKTFLAMNDSHFVDIIVNDKIEGIFASVVKEVLSVELVPRVIHTEQIIRGM